MLDHPTYLQCQNSGIYYFRIAVPSQLRVIVGKREIKHSLKTRNRQDAIIQSISLGSKINKAFNTLIRMEYGKPLVSKKPVQFEITKHTRNSLSELIKSQNLSYTDYLFKSRFHKSDHITTRQYARLLKTWLVEIGLDPYEYATHSIRRTKVSMIYQKTKNIRAIQLLLGHSNLDSTVRYLGVELDDALDVAENTEI